MDTYDESKIGRCIFARSSHAVYEYGENEVIKFDRGDVLLPGHGEHREFHDHAICKEFFGEYLLETKLVHSPDHTQLAQVQPRISGHYLCKADMADPHRAFQLKEILRRCKSLKEAGYAEIDLMGEGGAFRKCLSNIFVLGDGSLRIIDANLLDESYTNSPVLKIFVRWLSWWVARRQHRTIDFLLS